MKMKLKKDSLICFGIGLFIGILVWGLSPAITGKSEPWDAEGKYYPIALFISGALGYLLYPKSLLSTVMGIYMGQILYLLIFFVGPLWLIGIVLVGLYSVIALLGGGLVRCFCNGKRDDSIKIQ